MFEVKAHADDRDLVGHVESGPKVRGAPWPVTLMLGCARVGIDRPSAAGRCAACER